MLWVDRVGDRRSQAILARNFSLENGRPAEKGKKTGKLKSLANHARLAHSSAGDKEKGKEHNRDAHSGVQSSDERAGRGSIAAPSPRAP